MSAAVTRGSRRLRPELRIPSPKHAFQFAIQDLGPGLQQQVCASGCPLVAVGISVARYPPHRSVRALPCIRLLSWMLSVEANARVRMENTRFGQPTFGQSAHALPIQ